MSVQKVTDDGLSSTPVDISGLIQPPSIEVQCTALVADATYVPGARAIIEDSLDAFVADIVPVAVADFGSQGAASAVLGSALQRSQHRGLAGGSGRAAHVKRAGDQARAIRSSLRRASARAERQA